MSSNPCIQIFPLERGKSRKLVVGKQDETGTVDAFSGVCGIIMYQIWLSHPKVWIYDARVPGDKTRSRISLRKQRQSPRKSLEVDIRHTTTPLSTRLSISTIPNLYASTLDPPGRPCADPPGETVTSFVVTLVFLLAFSFGLPALTSLPDLLDSVLSIIMA